jgi:hypothetical protein
MGEQDDRMYMKRYVGNLLKVRGKLLTAKCIVNSKGLEFPANASLILDNIEQAIRSYVSHQDYANILKQDQARQKSTAGMIKHDSQNDCHPLTNINNHVMVAKQLIEAINYEKSKCVKA